MGSRIASIKSEKALSYADSFKRQCVTAKEFKHQSATARGDMFLTDVAVTIRIWYASRRPDLDESLILDLLQDVAYKNDRQVKEKHIYWMGVDKENPRCEIEVSDL
jgi:Holliday junction resolvase RusA-like endonuclease